MGLQRASEPGVEPVAVADLKLSLRVDGTDEDALLALMITTARMRCEELTRRSLITSNWKLTLDSFDDLCEIPRPPLVAVTAIQYTDSTGVLRTLDPSAYDVDATSAPARIEPVDQWPGTAAVFGAVQVTFSAGYGPNAVDVPQTLRQWITLAAGDFYAHREAWSDNKSMLLPFADGLLDEARLWPR
jgi:uncharacterized phiE125 gp8 family phage protein